MKFSTLTNPIFAKTSLEFLLAYQQGMHERKKHQDIWLITERPGQARDNGYCFYKYLREEHPEVDVYYVIERGASDRRKLLPYGEDRLIDFDSWQHYVMFCASKVHVSTHTAGCCPSNAPITKYLKSRLRYKDVFIPHGVSYGISEFCLKKYTDINLFICSGELEYRNVLEHYGYGEDEVALTGYPRLDGWHGASPDKNLIVLMPTWRAYLAQDPHLDFESSEYFQAYQRLISSSELVNMLEDNALELVFYLHDGMQPYASSFSAASPCIRLAGADDRYDIQELLKRGSLLVTDYSSVAFDFAYMTRPVIYYQFDRQEFFARQYRKGLFDFERDGFGPVALTQEELLSELRKAIGVGLSQTEEQKARMRAFYTLHDRRNCERVYEAIAERLSDAWSR